MQPRMLSWSFLGPFLVLSTLYLDATSIPANSYLYLFLSKTFRASKASETDATH